nr:UDP-glycosyltransferase 74E2-like isoform X3 [Ipomoea trifida]
MEIPDVIAVPFPYQGHLNPMLQFCSSLSGRGVRVTLVLTHGVAKSMPQSTLSQPFHTVECVSDGTDVGSFPRNFEELTRLPAAVSEGVAAIIQNQKEASGGSAAKVLVHDAMMPWLVEVGRAGGLRVASLFTQPASLCAIYYHMLHGHVVEQLTHSMLRLPSLPEMELRDLPSFSQFADTAKQFAELSFCQASNLPKADCFLINTFDSLEDQVVKWMADRWSVKTVGPLVPILHKDRIDLFELDGESYVQWLDIRESKSVVYLSFGSSGVFTEEQMEEIAWGLAQSNKYFIWQRKDQKLRKHIDMEMPDVIAVPYPYQGHLNPMLHFCSCLSGRGVRVTLVLTHGVAKSMPQSTLSQSFHTVECISDGTDVATSPRNLEENSRLPAAVSEGVAAIIQNQKKASGGSTAKVLVHDAMMPWLLEVGRAGGLRVASLFTQPASLCAIYYHMLHGHVVQQLTASHSMLRLPSLPEMELSDLPSFSHFADAAKEVAELNICQASNLPKADCFLINTFDSLEDQVVKWMADKWPVKTVGPLVPILHKDRIDLFELDTESHVQWLDIRESKSVVYVSFGSLAVFTEEQMQEIAWGLAQSNKYFIWQRKDQKLRKHMDMEMADVIAVPYPFQGHINPMLHFCSSLSARGVRVTLVLTHGVAKSMPQSTLSQPFHTVEFISDGTDVATSPRNLEDNSRFPGAVSAGVAAIIQNQKHASGAAAAKVLVHDAMMPWLLEVGRAGGLRVAALFTQPASLCAIYYHMLRGHVVQQLTDSHYILRLPSLPEMELSDLPSFSHFADDAKEVAEIVICQASTLSKADCFLINTFDSLEDQVVKWMANRWSVKTVGPLVPILHKDRLDLFELDSGSCIQWLDIRESKSVVYVSFGSAAVLTEEQMEEIAWGLAQSNKYFIWVTGGEKAQEFQRNAIRWKGLAKEAISEGGNFDVNINDFISEMAFVKSHFN